MEALLHERTTWAPRRDPLPLAERGIHHGSCCEWSGTPSRAANIDGSPTPRSLSLSYVTAWEPPSACGDY